MQILMQRRVIWEERYCLIFGKNLESKKRKLKIKMSRIGKKGIDIPEKTEVTVVNNLVSVKGPNGNLERLFRPGIKISIEGSHVSFAPERNNKQNAALWGTYASHISNMIEGVNTPFQKKLILEGVGFKSEIKPARPNESGHSGGGKKLSLALGFSHLVEVNIPDTLTVTAEKNIITVTGIDKEEVGSFTAKVRSLKKPEPYKGKGFRYEGEIIRRKEGKKSA